MQEYMQKRFLLNPDYMKHLRCFEYQGTVGEKPVRRLKIFDTRDADVKKITMKSISDFEKHPGMLLFEGYLDKLGNAYAADRRIPQKTKKINNK